jgi:putative DNA methylase
MTSPSYPKRLIEVDLPIKKISEHARREKSIRHGHISTLHIWWARRPLAACRAVICAALWPDPADPLCPESFKIEAKKQMEQFWNPTGTTPRIIDNPMELRKALLDFIADFSNWDNSTDERYLNVARTLTQSAHEVLGGEPGTRPLVVDPFAGGGSMPLEALRIGADAYASDLNPVAVLLNKVVLEYIPKYGQNLTDDVLRWGLWVKKEAEKELSEFYPNDPDGSIPIAYLWARTITCEGPGCGAEVPLIRSLWLAKKGSKSVAINLIPNSAENRVDFEIIRDPKPSEVKGGTVKRGSTTCPCCGYTTPVARVREQLKIKNGGAENPLLYCVVSARNNGETIYRLPTQRDHEIIANAKTHLDKILSTDQNTISVIPNETLPIMSGVFNAPIYGHSTWGSLFTPRQALMLATYVRLVRDAPLEDISKEESTTIRILLALTVSKMTSFNSSLCIWRNVRTCVAQTFGRQALPMVWDFGEMNPFVGSAGDFSEAIDYLIKFLDHVSDSTQMVGQCEKSDATKLSLPSDCVSLLSTDPPYYNAVPYADLSDFFYIWLRRMLYKSIPLIFEDQFTPKTQEICEMAGWDPERYPNKTGKWFEKQMSEAMSEAYRVTSPNALAIVVFAHKTVSGWEALLQALIDAGWVITASWPIDTERSGRLRAHESAVLASSIHLVCRPRKSKINEIHVDDIGEWSDVLAELPLRIHDWMPRLAAEGVIGADAIFACLGPALEIFSRYSRVEKASGEQVTLKEYLEKVWEAVENEALKVIFEGADTSGFEEDARLTAMWLWTMKAGANGGSSSSAIFDEGETEDDADETPSSKSAKIAGYGLEYDAARKISQGLGAHPEEMPTLIEIKKGNARLLSVAERAPFLFGKQDLAPKRKAKKRDAQLTLFPGEAVAEEPADYGSLGEMSTFGKTILDRVHQSMLLFGNGKSEELKRFLIEEEIGKDPRFKKLAQALVALYPAGSEEKRWAEGVMSRMKGLGL